MKYILYLYQSFKSNDIYFTFGMPKQEVHDLMDKEPDYIMNTLEYYNDFRVDYDSNDKVSAFEFFSWADVILENDDFPDLKGINLFSISNRKLDRTVKEYDNSAEIDSDGIVSLKYGIGTYCENSNSEPSDAVIIFRKGYYDGLL